LSDYGNADLIIMGFSVTAPFIENNSCGTNLVAGNSCNINIGVVAHTNGQHSGTLAINDNAPGSPQQINLTVTSSCR
jgi:hypothetical protein